MPFKPFKRDGKYCVYKIDSSGNATGESRGCHSTRAEAISQIRAIEANMDEKGISYLVERPNSNQSYFRVKAGSDGRLHWIAGAYSNSFRDNDNPPEIISADSHKRFARMVWEKEIAPPDAWVWHERGWKFGTGTWVSYDEVAPGIVFAIAGGVVDEGAEELALALDKMAGKALSHGMPLSSIAREEQDSSIIIEHITEEVSVLPVWAAANKLTAQRFTVMEEKMAIPNKKELLEKEAVDPALLDSIEAANKETAVKAVSEGMAFKEAGNADEDNSAVEAKDASVAEDVEETEVEDVQEKAAQVADVDYEQLVAKSLEPVVLKINEMFAELRGQIAELEEANTALKEAVGSIMETMGELAKSETERVAEKAAQTPIAGLLSLLDSNQSVVGRKEAQIDGRSSLAKSGPAESEPGNGRANGLFLSLIHI